MATGCILGQKAPAATTLTLLYLMDSGTGSSARAEIFKVCNRGSDATTFRMAVKRGGETLSAKHYLYYDLPIPGNDTFEAEPGALLQAGDAIWVYAGNANLSFSLFGTESL